MEFHINWYERLPSTNTFLKEMVKLKGQVPSGTVVAAREQTQGRGRLQRQWLTSANENLTFSMLLRNKVEAYKWPSATMAAAVAVNELLQNEGINAVLKWPNDVLVGGRKICGILSEGFSGGLIIGIGLNVNMKSAGHIDQPATSMLIETGERRNIDELLGKLLTYLDLRLGQWLQGGFPSIRKNWDEKVPNIGKPVTVSDGGSMRTGILRGFGENGELLLEENGALSSIWAGDLSV
ncbi:MAG: BirA family transcriptional regulator [Verrucomicrobiota bacterium]|nr:BirA family transcriptional regulator [Verrucomicrobiota bacterium]